MTDEEKAEKYAKGRAHEHYHFLFEENNGSPIDFAKLCHLDGLAEGKKEKWHDLRKDPNDLPKERGGYLILHEDNTGFTHYSIRDFRHGYFECTNTIIAWCELPKFKE